MLCSLAATLLSYAFPVGSNAVYDFQVDMDGYVPIMGRTQNQIQVKLVVEVRGSGALSEGNVGVTSDFREMKASLGGVSLPFTVDDVKTYFPKTTLTLNPQGKVIKTDAPDIEMPIRLPGLDSKRFPDISFLPLEFPVEGVELGKAWSFKRKFGSSDIDYTATPTEITDDTASFEVKILQKTSFFEDTSAYEVKEEKDAVHRVEMTFTGTGQVVFDRKRSLVSKFVADSEAVSLVKNLKTDVVSIRSVKTKLKVGLRPSPAFAE